MRQPPDELGPEQNARQAWQDGYEEGHEAALGEVQGIKAFYLMHSAMYNDVPLTPDQVKLIWYYAFLTNIIVPILEHIKRHDDKMLDEMSLDPEDTVRKNYYEKRMVDLDHVQDILREWGG